MQVLPQPALSLCHTPVTVGCHYLDVYHRCTLASHWLYQALADTIWAAIGLSPYIGIMADGHAAVRTIVVFTSP